MYNKIKELIKSRCKDIDSKRLVYFTNYFFTLVTKKIIPKNIELEDLIDNAYEYVKDIVFYDENHPKYKELGPDVKGLRDPKDKTLYIRYNLDEDLQEITSYHEIHHATQTNPKNNEVGINQTDNLGRMIMEAQTQYFAEQVYCMMHQISFEDKMILTEKLRMQSGGTVVSNLHNYEMYDAMLSKLAILLDVSKDYFVTINFLYDEGLKNLEKRYNEVRNKYNINLTFEGLMQILDYVYVVDFMAYKDNDDKEVILSDKETKEEYEIYKNFGSKLSLKQEFDYIYTFDKNIILSLLESQDNDKIVSFSKYIIDNNMRNKINNYIKSYIK